jgi:hypothetical protein
MRFDGADGLAGDDLIAIVLGLLGGRRYRLFRLGRGTFGRAALGGVGALGCCGRGSPYWPQWSRRPAPSHW